MANVADALVVLVRLVVCTFIVPVLMVTLASVKLPTVEVVEPNVMVAFPNVALLFVK